jgi:hypothetical protein
MKKIFLILLTIISLGSLTAQSFVHKINPYPSQTLSNINQLDSVKILAVMVEFQEDRDNATFGNGKFGSIYTGDNAVSKEILDPLPHDKNYFEDHLQFAVNYYQNVSNDNFNVSFTVLDSIVTLSQTMRNYSPDQNSDDLSPLGTFAQEVWQLADQANPQFNFADYDMFMVFHAGVGRDVNLPGSIGIERDLPSVFLGEKTLKNIFGEGFNGFAVSGGGFNITNTAVLPVTESREIAAIGGSVLLELSINGLIVANIASYMGLPDLFDTETGLSAIGRFGLMDGQSIFAYGGTFPPEPSPWEKIQFGWIEPTLVEFTQQEISLNLVAERAAAIGDTTILKIPINQTEYYLVENRSRDALGNGAVITYKVNGEERTLNIPEDVDGFRSYNVDTLAGVITGVDEYDWAVPGNGIVIWHIDEKIINEKLASNSINADIENRGVDIEEADGVQDIGVEFVTIFGDVVIGEGSDEDFWYSGNPAALYENVFNADSKPNTNANDGAASLISISDFSEISNKMSFKVKFGKEKFGIVSSTQLPWTEKVEFINTQKLSTGNVFYLISNNRLDRVNEQGEVTNSFDSFSSFMPAAIELNNDEYVFGVVGTQLNVFRKTNSFDLVSSYSFDETFSCAPVINQYSTDNIAIVLGTTTGKVLAISLNAAQSSDPDTSNIRIITDLLGENVKQISVSEFGLTSAISDNKHNGPSDFQLTDYQFEGKLVKLATAANRAGYVDVVSDDRNNLYVIDNDKVTASWKVPGSSDSHTFSISNFGGDADNYIFYPAGSKLYAYNLTGALAENFPYEDKKNQNIWGTPLSADLNADLKSEIIITTDDGRIIALDGSDGEILKPFPLSLGAKGNSSPVIYNNQSPVYFGELFTFFTFVSEGNEISIWKIGDISGSPMWAGEFGGNLNSSYTAQPAVVDPLETEFFPKNKAYNYPNPVYDNQTFIRYFVSEDSNVEIKIFDLAGDLVDELTDTAIGNFDNETVWNVSEIQSGVYFANIDVTGNSGNSDSKIIKIVIIK